jgi:thioredoxin
MLKSKIMNKSSFLVMGLLFALAIGCNGQSDKSSSSEDKTPAPANATLASNTLPVHISKEDFVKLVMDYNKNPETWIFAGKKPCLVDFYADWCAPCRITSPILEELSKEYAGKIDIYKVNIDKERELASLFNVQSIPTFLFCPMEGNPTISSGIANTPDATKQMFREQINQILLKNNGSKSL